MKILKSLIIVIFCFSTLCNAQKTEYLVLENNDTIYGRKLIFKGKSTGLKIEKNKIIYNDSLIKGYYESRYKSYYEKVLSPFSWDYRKPNKMVFIKRLTNEGKIKLYYEASGSGTTYFVNLFISKDGSKLKELPTGGGFGRMKFAKKSTYEELKPFIKDNKEILVELDTIKPTKDAFIKLINKYNESFE